MLKRLPNTVSILRVLLSIPLFASIVTTSWATAFWLFIAACFTDTIDGPLARRLGTENDTGRQLDHAGDAATLVALGVGLVAAGALPTTMWVQMLIGLVAGRVFARRVSKHPSSAELDGFMFAIGAIALVTILTSAGLYLCVLAFGWSWWYPAVTALILLPVCVIKRGRIAGLWENNALKQ